MMIEDDSIMISNSPQNESQVCLPRRSKRMSPGQSNDSTRIETKEGSNEATEGTEEVILLYPNSSFSREESVFSIDHILEAILEELDQSTLLNLRLVSRRWAIFGAKELQKIVTLRFVQPPPVDVPGTIYITQSRIYNFELDKNRSIDDLVTVMNNSAEFPSTSFSFLNRHDVDVNETIQPFFDSHGTSIKKLRFDGDLYLHDLSDLLLTQAPNLETFLIRGRIILFDEEPSEEEGGEFSPEERADVDICLFHDFYDGNPNPKQILKNLKVFKSPSILPNAFLTELLEACPNLNEVFLPPQSLPCLLRPVNRLHLLKKLIISFDEYNIRSLEFVANPQNHQFNWKVEQLFKYYARMVGVMSGITRGVASTCTKLVWAYGLKGLKFPSMSCVKQLIVRYNEGDNPLLREGERLAETWPSLESLIIRTDATFNAKNLIIDDVLGGFDKGLPLTVPVDTNVRVVTLDFQPSHDFVESCDKMLPNATIITDLDGFESEDDEDSIGIRYFW